MLDGIGKKFKDYAPLMLRLGLSTLMILKGAQLLSDHIGRNDVVELLIGAVYLLGGLLVLIGWMTRWAAAAFIVLLFLAILDGPRLHAITEPRSQYLFAALMMSVALFCSGGGEKSVDMKQKRKEEK